MQGLLLGLASGTACLAYCAPALLPYMLGEGRSVCGNYFILAQFLAGRLVGYLCFGLVAWFLGTILEGDILFKNLTGGISFFFLGGLMAYYGIKKPKTKCMAEHLNGAWPSNRGRVGGLLPLFMGVLTGVNLCPPFLLAFTGAAMEGSLAKSIFYFFTFFLGTSVFFLPLPAAGIVAGRETVRLVGKMAALLMSAYYSYTGIILLLGGVFR